jgi:uncharacterized protein YndB with AHSA1/START domain
MTNAIAITIEIDAPIEHVWKVWTTPGDIRGWNNVSDKWHTPRVLNDVRTGGQFLFTMGLKDGSFMFDFAGVYDDVKTNEQIDYTLNDGRRSAITFEGSSPVKLTERFEPNDTDPINLQRDLCRSVLLSFKAYAESKL